MRVLVTGAAGFAGRWLIRDLLAHKGTEVVGLYHTTEPDRSSNAHFMQADLTDQDRLESIIATTHPDSLVHLAAISRPQEAKEDPKKARRVNIEASETILRAIGEKAPGCKLLLVSSSEIYGKTDPEENPLTEERSGEPATIYGETKRAMENLCHDAFERGLNVVIARSFNHTGPGQAPGFAAPDFAWQVARIEAGLVAPVITTGNLEAQRDFCDVRDVACAYRLLLEKGVSGQTYNVCSGRPTPIQNILDTLLRISTHSTIQHAFDPDKMRPSENRVTYGSHQKLTATTGWEPTYDLEQTLADLLHSCRSFLSGQTGLDSSIRNG